MLNSHRAWAYRLNKVLICGLEPSEEMVAQDAHLHCTLGNWLATRARELDLEDWVQKEIVGLGENAAGSSDIFILIAGRDQTVEIEHEADFAIWGFAAECLHGLAVGQHQVMGGSIGLGVVANAGSMEAGGVAKESRHPGLVDGGP